MKKTNRMNDALFHFDDINKTQLNETNLLKKQEPSHNPFLELPMLATNNLNNMHSPTSQTTTSTELDQDLAYAKLLIDDDASEKKLTTQEMFEQEIQDFDNAKIDHDLMYPTKKNREDDSHLIDENAIFNDAAKTFVPKIAVIGIGGAGNNIVEDLVSHKTNLKINCAVQFYQLNTDFQHLQSLRYGKNRLLIESNLTKGMGTGGDPEIGRKVTEENAAKIEEILRGVDLCMVVAGMGKGTGTGGAPVIAKIAKKMNILTLGFVTLPMHHEGKTTTDKALAGLAELNKTVDAISTLSNDQIMTSQHMALTTNPFERFKNSNQQIGLSIKIITDIILVPTFVNIDLADVKNFFARKNEIKSFLSMHVAFKKDEFNKMNEKLVRQLKYSLFDQDLKNASNVMVLFKFGPNTPHNMVDKGMNEIRQIAKNENLQILFGIQEINDLEEEVGFDLIALQESAISIGTPKALSNRLKYSINNNYNSIVAIEQPNLLPSHSSGQRTRYWQKQNKSNTETTLVSYSIIEGSINELMKTKKTIIDTDSMSKIVNQSVKTFFHNTQKQNVQNVASTFRDSKLFEN